MSPPKITGLLSPSPYTHVGQNPQ